MRSLLSLAFIGLLVLAAPAAAQDKPFSMAGTWINKGESVSLGESHHPEHGHKEAEPKVVQTSLRVVIDKHVGTSFWGTSTGTSGVPERIVGATNGKRGSAVNSRGGIYQLVVVDANTLEACYAVGTEKFLAASCTTWTRQ